jgi:hypothetical protein
MTTTSFVTALLQHIFQNANIALVGDATGLRSSTAAGSLYISLHTADPGRAGSQTTNEATYTGYARLAIVRSGAGWTVAGNQASNAAIATFAQCTAGSNTITHFGIGTDPSGAGQLIGSGPVGSTNQGPLTATAADVLTLPGHTLVVNDTVQFFALYGVALPTGITEGTTYFVKTVSGNDITISTTQGGATLDITAAGDGMCFKVSTLAVSVNIAPEFAIGQLVHRME